MMAITPVPRDFRKSAPPVIQFAWADAVAGVGYIRFYGGCWMKHANSHQYFLTTTSEFDSSTGDDDDTTGIYTKFTGDGSEQTILTMDITFNKSMKIAEAAAFVSVSIAATIDAVEVKPKFSINHVQGAVVTEIGVETVDENLFAAGEERRFSASVPITGKQFAVGDILRLIIKATITSTEKVLFYHDPASGLTLTDTEGRTIGTDLTIDLPIEADV